MKKLILTTALFALFSCGSVPSIEPMKQYEVQVMHRDGRTEIIRFESRFIKLRQGDLLLSDDQIGEIHLFSDVRQFIILSQIEK